jgi:hypothetical protein
MKRGNEIAVERRSGTQSRVSLDAVSDDLVSVDGDHVASLRELAIQCGMYYEHAIGWLRFIEGSGQIGFTTTLCGTHTQTEGELGGCQQCECVTIALRAIANHVLPSKIWKCAADPVCTHEIRVLPRTGVHVSKMELTLIHSTETYPRDDSSDLLCLERIRMRLRDLGIENRRNDVRRS